MGQKLWCLFLLIFSFSNNPILAQNQGNTIEGRWLREDKKNYIVEIYRCADKYCGKIVWMKEPNNDQGQPRKDTENPEKALRERPLIGMDILETFDYLGENKWDGGTIYSFNRGKKYDAKINLKGNKLQLTASILFFSKSYTWIRVE